MSGLSLPLCQRSPRRRQRRRRVIGGNAQAQDLQGDVVEATAEAVCPNCGQRHISTAAIPRNEGDQLMVHKHAYQFRDPRRWEVIVFKNPSDPLQAYVKRVVGLPGETVSIHDGDISINNELQPRSLETIRSMGILVDDHDHQPQDDPNWQSRWIVTRALIPPGKRKGAAFRFAAPGPRNRPTSIWNQISTG